jgi:hypothetical protein
MGMFRKLILSIFALAFLPLATNAANYFEEREVFVVPRDGECVGQNTDPICVFDTVVACVIRDQPDLCEKVGMEYSQSLKNAVSYSMSGKDYKYQIVELFMNRRKNGCDVVDNKSCVYNDATGQNVKVDASLTDDKNFGVYMQRGKKGTWKAVFADKADCWSDTNCD